LRRRGLWRGGAALDFKRRGEEAIICFVLKLAP
jgi:hypothetical protein